MRPTRLLSLLAVVTIAACGSQPPAITPASPSPSASTMPRPSVAIPSLVRRSTSLPPVVSAVPASDASTTPSSSIDLPLPGTPSDAAALINALEGLAQPLPQTDVSSQTSAVENATPPLF